MQARIALSGSAGVGKTTLARRVAAELGIAYIPEGMREYLESGAPSLHALGPDGVRELILRLWEERKAAEAHAGAFVADRASYDFAAFWLYYRYARPDDPVTERLLAETRDPHRYDHVFLLPHGALPLVADGVRSTDPWVQLHVQLLVEGMVHRCARRITAVRATALDARVVEVIAALRGSG